MSRWPSPLSTSCSTLRLCFQPLTSCQHLCHLALCRQQKGMPKQRQRRQHCLLVLVSTTHYTPTKYCLVSHARATTFIKLFAVQQSTEFQKLLFLYQFKPLHLPFAPPLKQTTFTVCCILMLCFLSAALVSPADTEVIDMKVMMVLGAFNVLVCDQSCNMADIKIQGTESQYFCSSSSTLTSLNHIWWELQVFMAHCWHKDDRLIFQPVYGILLFSTQTPKAFTRRLVTSPTVFFLIRSPLIQTACSKLVV